MKRPTSRSGGSTLLLALWALIVLSAVVFAWVQSIDRGIGELNEANRGMEARGLAHTGMAVALHPGVTRQSAHLRARFEDGRMYAATIQSEGGRLNVNYFLAGGDPAKLAFFKSYLAARGLTFQQREVLMDCLLDWVNPGGGVRRPNAAPERPGYHPPHRALQSLEEMTRVAGSGPLVSDPGWKEAFTLYSAGPLDLESVPAGLLGLVPGIGEQRAQRFVKIREEREREGVNPDGHAFKNLAEALSCLGITPQEFTQLSAFLEFRDPVVRIKSLGQSGKVIRQVEAVVRKVPGEKSQILLWIEK